MVPRPSLQSRDDIAMAPPSSVMRFVLAAGSLMSVFAFAAVLAGELLGG